jgi:signal transduction histidine kinase
MTDSTPHALDLKLMANFVHQVVNPLNGVIGTVDNLIDGTIPRANELQRLRAVRSQLEWCVLLVRNLAFFAESAGGASLTTEKTSGKRSVLPQVIIEAALFFQETGLQRGIRVELTDRQTQFQLAAPPELLRQVFMNLIDNAVKYGDDDTLVRITPAVQKKTNTLLVEVESIGTGFTEIERARLFEVGFRSDDARLRVATGTGLGLFICKRIIEDICGGTIEAEHSRQSRRTVFRIRFPTWTVQ